LHADTVKACWTAELDTGLPHFFGLGRKSGDRLVLQLGRRSSGLEI